MKQGSIVGGAEANARLGAQNREAVRKYFSEHIGCTRGECARALKLHPGTVAMHIRRLRLDWEPHAQRGHTDAARA